MDSSSWCLTLQVARRSSGTLLVVAGRSEAPSFPEEHRALLGLAAEVLRLGNLSELDMLALARERLGVEGLPREVGELILRKAQGNPLYGEELAYALRDSGALSIEGGHCRVRDGVDLVGVGVPDTVEGIINDRVDRLAPTEQLVLKVASVVGRQFALKILRDVHPIEGDRTGIPRDLDALSRLELILPDDPEPERSYAFRHAITKDVVYDLLPFAHRRKLHRAIAEWYERSGDAGPSTRDALLAHHWSMEGNDARAVDYLEKAGDRALRGGAYREAVVFLERALELDARGGLGCRPERVARWEHQLGEASLALGQLSKGREHATKALALLGRPIPSKVRLPMAYLGAIASATSRRVRARSDSAEARASSRLASSAFGLLGQLCYFDQDRAIGVYAALRSLVEAESPEPSPELARALAVMGIACGLVPAHRLAESYRNRASRSPPGSTTWPAGPGSSS